MTTTRTTRFLLLPLLSLALVACGDDDMMVDDGGLVIPDTGTGRPVPFEEQRHPLTGYGIDRDVHPAVGCHPVGDGGGGIEGVGIVRLETSRGRPFPLRHRHGGRSGVGGRHRHRHAAARALDLGADLAPRDFQSAAAVLAKKNDRHRGLCRVPCGAGVPACPAVLDVLGRPEAYPRPLHSLCGAAKQVQLHGLG